MRQELQLAVHSGSGPSPNAASKLLYTKHMTFFPVFRTDPRAKSFKLFEEQESVFTGFSYKELFILYTCMFLIYTYVCV